MIIEIRTASPSRPWRAIPSFLFLAAAAAAATPPLLAQRQESRMQQILEPDLGRAYEFRENKDSIDYLLRSKSSLLKSYANIRPAKTKSFETKTFRVDKKFRDSRAANGSTESFQLSTQKVIPNKDRSIEASRIDPIASPMAARGPAPVRRFPFLRKAEVKGSRQTILDQQYGDPPALTIEQVRELLNKNK